MNDLDFSFDRSPWEATLDTLRSDSVIGAARFLALLEGEDEDAVENAFLDLEQKHISLDISSLPAESGTGDTALRLEREKELAAQGNLMEALSEADPLRLYLEDLAALPAAGDPILLADLSAQGDENARAALLNVSLHRVITLANELAGRGVLLLDLYQEGSLGLWQAILNWRADGDFEAHRDWWIRQSLAKTLVLQARTAGTGQKMRKALEDFRAADRRLLTQLGRNPTLEEISLELNLTAEDGAILGKMLQDANLVAKAKEAQEPRELDADAEQAVEDTAYFQSRQRIMEMLSGLDELDAKLLTLRFGLEGGLPLSPEDTGRKLGLTPEAVVSREAAALAKLRNNT